MYKSGVSDKEIIIYCVDFDGFIDKNKAIHHLSNDFVKRFINNQLLVDNKFDIITGCNGKPYVIGVNKFYISKTYTHEKFYMAVSLFNIGLDAELVRPINIKIAERFFTEKEKKFISTSNDKMYDFYKIWTRKEAYVKATGSSLVTELKNKDVTEDKIDQNEFSFSTFQMDRTIMTLCVQKSDISDLSYKILKFKYSNMLET
jgi:4'-phosphopantetheinyl transferase